LGLLEIEVELEIAGRRPMQFRKIITEFQLGREGEWLSRFAGQFGRGVGAEQWLLSPNLADSGGNRASPCDKEKPSSVNSSAEQPGRVGALPFPDMVN